MTIYVLYIFIIYRQSVDLDHISVMVDTKSNAALHQLHMLASILVKTSWVPASISQAICDMQITRYSRLISKILLYQEAD